MTAEFPRKVKIDDSSNLAAAFFNPKTEEMVVKFKESGDYYLYKGVPSILFGELISSESVGTTFHKLFRKNEAIKYERLD